MILKHERLQENIRCWFAQRNAPAPVFLCVDEREDFGIRTSLSSPTRAYIHVSLGVLNCLRESSRGHWMFGTSLLVHQPCGVPTAIDGGREAKQIRYALQWILHVHCGKFFIEIDFDGWNPGEGALPAMIHLFAEVIPNKILKRQTDPFKVAKYRKWE